MPSAEPGTSVPEPPWMRRPESRRAGRAPLSREAIVDAAITLLDREGLDGFSMRSLADELGTGPATLYWHVRGRSELLTMVIDRVIAEVEVPEPEPERWQDQVKELGREMRRTMGRHRDVARLTFGQIPVGPNATIVSERTLAILRSAGLPSRTCAYALDLLSLYVGSIAFEDSLGLQSPTGEDLAPEEVIEMIRGYWASLPAEKFPNTLALLDELMAGSPDERFEWGLDVIVRGLAATVAE
jgi:AcrR family transcriptional regulator